MKFYAKMFFVCMSIVSVAFGVSKVDQDLLDAVQAGNVEATRKALKAGANVNAQDDEGFTPAHIACKKGRTELLDILTKNCADLTIKNKFHFTAPMYLLANGIEMGKIDRVAKALDLGISVNTKMENKLTALHVAAYAGESSEAIVKFLLGRGADIKAVDRFGNTPLHCAALTLNIPVFELLLKEKGADLKTRNNEGLTPADQLLRAAVGENDIEVAKRALRLGADINMRLDGKNLLFDAVFNKLSTIEFLLQNKIAFNVQDALGNTPAHTAAINDYEKKIELLKKYGADLTIKNKEGKTPLDLLTKYKESEK